MEFVYPHRFIVLPRQENSFRDMCHELPVTRMLHVLPAIRLVSVGLNDHLSGDIVRREDADEAPLRVLVGLGKQGVQGRLVHHAQGGLLSVALPSGDDAVGYPELLGELHEAHAYGFTQCLNFTSGPFRNNWHGLPLS
ncbi:hypothetical protein OHB53_25005 [Streptomyces sp. NBC_00056]|uniref:hypothetical protein n=1 Tax=Streptomyces sp. NBC_00056 TaxID=2975633 RepID=UPI0032508C0C